MHVVQEHLLVIGLYVYITHCQNPTLYLYFACVLCNSPLLTLRLTTSKKRKYYYYITAILLLSL